MKKLKLVRKKKSRLDLEPGTHGPDAEPVEVNCATCKRSITIYREFTFDKHIGKMVGSFCEKAIWICRDCRHQGRLKGARDLANDHYTKDHGSRYPLFPKLRPNYLGGTII